MTIGGDTGEKEAIRHAKAVERGETKASEEQQAREWVLEADNGFDEACTSVTQRHVRHEASGLLKDNWRQQLEEIEKGFRHLSEKQSKKKVDDLEPSVLEQHDRCTAYVLSEAVKDGEFLAWKDSFVQDLRKFIKSQKQMKNKKVEKVLDGLEVSALKRHANSVQGGNLAKLAEERQKSSDSISSISSVGSGSVGSVSSGSEVSALKRHANSVQGGNLAKLAEERQKSSDSISSVGSDSKGRS